MARVLLLIEDAAIHLTLKTLLEASGHSISEREPDVAVADTASKALDHSARHPTLLLASANEIPGAVAAMRKGVYGYIFLPLQPGESVLMVERAAASRRYTDGRGETMEVATLESVELHHILQVLRQCKYNQARAARALGIGRNTLWRKLKRARDSGVIDETGRPTGRSISE